MQTLNGTLQSIPRVSTCKICGCEAPLHGVADFNKNCEEHRGRYLPLTGVPVYYHRCRHCGLIFTTAFDHWSKADYLQHIYNDDYVVVDPDYIYGRPANNVLLISDFIRNAIAPRCIDYGGGNGQLAALLRERGVDGYSWDPMGDDENKPPSGSFDLVTAFEVLEHTPAPVATVEQALGFLNGRGAMLFSTLTIDHLPPRAMDFWYIAPRNGHITIYTQQSLQSLFARFGYRVLHFNPNFHLALKEAPDWLPRLRDDAAS
ncbi:MAG TPA: class I SAM-dependent methyltransferase, partial [Paraburkholderia sp.]|jgi:SAM-dependent methyltransferase